MRFLLASRSPHKLREIAAILEPAAIRLVSLDELGIPETPEEDAIEVFETFRENAVAKARFFAARSGLPTLADDSGLEVQALGGQPGVRTRRWANRPDLSGQALDDANNALLLDRLAGLAPEHRHARYVCAAAVASPAGAVLAAIGTTPGIIALTRSGGSGGFGYDPIFFVPELGATFAQVSPEEKHRRSHRARAFRALAAHVAALAR